MAQVYRGRLRVPPGSPGSVVDPTTGAAWRAVAVKVMHPDVRDPIQVPRSIYTSIYL